MTPVFLTLLVLSKRGVNRVVLRVTAMVGVIIGCYNMGNFASWRPGFMSDCTTCLCWACPFMLC